MTITELRQQHILPEIGYRWQKEQEAHNPYEPKQIAWHLSHRTALEWVDGLLQKMERDELKDRREPEAAADSME